MNKNVISRAKKLAKSKTFPIINGNVMVRNGMAHATNLETSIMFPVPIKGEGVVPISVLESEFKNAEIKDGIFYYENNGTTRKFRVGEGNEFPLPFPNGTKFGQEHNINTALLHELQPFCANDELRPALNGIYASIENQEMVACDATILVRKKSEISFSSVIFSAESVKYLQSDEAKVSFCEEKKYAIFLFSDGETAVVRLIDAEYPNYIAVIPSSSKFDIVANRKEILVHIENASKVFDAKSKSKPVIIAGMGNKMLVHSFDIENGGEYSAVVPISSNATERFITSFDSRVAKKAIQFSKEENVSIKIRSVSGAIILDELNLFMPIHMQNDISHLDSILADIEKNTASVNTPCEESDAIMPDEMPQLPEPEYISDEKSEADNKPYSAEEKNAGNEGINYRINEELGGLEIAFDEKPEEAVIEMLKAAGFRWSRFNRVWYRKLTPEVKKALSIAD